MDRGQLTKTHREGTDTSAFSSRWASHLSHVQAILRWIQARPSITPQQIVAWDETHGKRIFTWDDATAAVAYRLYEARLFLNSFTRFHGRLRIRAFVNLPNQGDDGASEDGPRTYVPIDRVLHNANMKEQAINDCLRRIKTIAATLRFFRLSPAKAMAVVNEIRQIMLMSSTPPMQMPRTRKTLVQTARGKSVNSNTQTVKYRPR